MDVWGKGWYNGTGLGLSRWNGDDQRSAAVHRAFKHHCELTGNYFLVCQSVHVYERLGPRVVSATLEIISGRLAA